MTERMEHEEFDRLLGSGSGFDEGELAGMARLARALERSRPSQSGPAPAFRDALRTRLLQEARTEVVIPLSLAARMRASVGARNARMRRSLRAITATAAAAAMLMITSSAFALTAETNPSKTGYEMKRFRERLQLVVAFGNVAKAQKELDFARERYEEVRNMIDDGVESAALYARAFTDMDSSTTRATSRLIRQFRATEDAGALRPLVDFSRAQRASLEAVFDDLPPGARPAARSSIELVVAVQDRVNDVLGGCPCPDDVFVPADTTVAGPAEPCRCAPDRTDASGLPRRGDGSGGSTTTKPSPGPTTSPTPEPDDGVLPDLPGTVDDTVDHLLGEVLDGLGVSPSPLPSLPPLLP